MLRFSQHSTFLQARNTRKMHISAISRSAVALGISLSDVSTVSELRNRSCRLTPQLTLPSTPRQTPSQISCPTFPRENTAPCRRTVRSEQRRTFRDFHGDEWRVPRSSPLDSPRISFSLLFRFTCPLRSVYHLSRP